MRQYIGNRKLLSLFIHMFFLASIQLTAQDQDSAYVFPIETHDISRLTWTADHWDGSNAVDIFFEPGMDLDDPDFVSFSESRILAVSDGTVRRFDNERGGRSLILEARNGYRFYYAHLSEVFIESGTRVRAGQALGRIGNTGRRARLIEPHLHFEVSSPANDNEAFVSDIKASRWLREQFGYYADTVEIEEYPASIPRGVPVRAETRIIRTFDESSTLSSDTASVDLEVVSDLPAPIYAPLIGEIRVHRSPVFGMRVQVTNRPLDETVLISGSLKDIQVQFGDVVYPGDIVAYATGTVNIMYYKEGRLANPESFF
ncbi:MAG: M23 family metallopeptidase [Spirochaetaceae bacterium]